MSLQSTEGNGYLRTLFIKPENIYTPFALGGKLELAKGKGNINNENCAFIVLSTFLLPPIWKLLSFFMLLIVSYSLFLSCLESACFGSGFKTRGEIQVHNADASEMMMKRKKLEL